MRRVRVPTAGLVAGSAFDGSRNLRVVLDDDIRSDDALELLEGFAHHELVDMYSTQPAPGVAQIELGPHDRDNDSMPYRVGTRRSWLPSMFQWDHFADELAGDVPRDQAYQVLVLAQVAAAVGADAFVTSNPVALELAPRGLVQNANPMTAHEAAAVLGLYLRLRGDFTTAKSETFEQSLSRGLFYWLLTRALLKAAWRWFSACARSAHETGDDSLLYLSQSGLKRFDRVLRARDRVLQQAQLPPDGDTGDEAIFYLDVALLMLAGAFDVVAGVAHECYSLRGTAGWRRPDWRERLVAVEPAFASPFVDGSRARDVIDIVALLRNTIHGPALSGLAVSEGGSPSTAQNHVLLPEGVRERVLGAVGRQGGPELWGISDHGAGWVTLESDMFLELLIPKAAEILNELMDATDIARLPGVTPETVPGGPPPDDELFSAREERAVRLLAGMP